MTEAVRDSGRCLHPVGSKGYQQYCDWSLGLRCPACDEIFPVTCTISGGVAWSLAVNLPFAQMLSHRSGTSKDLWLDPEGNGNDEIAIWCRNRCQNQLNQEREERRMLTFQSRASLRSNSSSLLELDNSPPMPTSQVQSSQRCQTVMTWVSQ